MSENRMLIVPAELVKKINENRGDISQAEFINFLIDSRLGKETKEPHYVTKEELRSFEQDMRKLLRSFLDFFVNYGLEMGRQSQGIEFDELIGKLQGLQKDLDTDNDEKKGTIKWK